MTPFIIKRGTSTALPDSYVSGTLYFCTDTAEIYMDTTDDFTGRIRITNQELETKVANLIADLNNLSSTVTSNDEALQAEIDSLKPIVAQDISVASTSWSSDSTYTDFPYRSTITITGVTADMVPEVTFAPTEALSGNYAPVAATYTGGVYIYSKVSTAITIPTIICHPKGSS